VASGFETGFFGMQKRQFQKEITWILNEKYGGVATGDFKKDVERLKKGEPVDYVIGWCEFLGCRINLSHRPFIPRPETEYWVKLFIESLRSRQVGRNNPANVLNDSGLPRPDAASGDGNDEKNAIRCLDLFAGSGCIGIAILKHIPETYVDFAERNKKFCDQIQKNLDINRIEPPRCRVIQSNIFSRISSIYDYILANPPYVPLKRKRRVQTSVLKWEPEEAVFGGENGLSHIEKILGESLKYLKKGGKLIMEFDSSQKKDIGVLIEQRNFSGHYFFRDQYGRWRYAIAET
jgi:release factor glutamine methyltransferase